MSTDFETQYKKDLQNYIEKGELGEDWCPQEVVSAIITWIRSNFEADDPILSLGCGNGMLLNELFGHGFTNLTGIDSSSDAIELARRIAADNSVKIKLEVCNVMKPVESGGAETACRQIYKLLVDKGMFDSISYDIEKMKANRDQYLASTSRLLAVGGYLLIASGNHTEEELLFFFRKQPHQCYEVVTVLPTPVLEFGGKMGHNITVLVCRKMH